MKSDEIEWNQTKPNKTGQTKPNVNGHRTKVDEHQMELWWTASITNDNDDGQWTTTNDDE